MSLQDFSSKFRIFIFHCLLIPLISLCLVSVCRKMPVTPYSTIEYGFFLLSLILHLLFYSNLSIMIYLYRHLAFSASKSYSNSTSLFNLQLIRSNLYNFTYLIKNSQLALYYSFS